jgi:cyclic pyranopterin phosphate synthase
MEAFVGAAVAALTVVDMGKSMDRGMVIEGLRLIEKEGGRSGHYLANGAKKGGGKR